MAARRRVAHAEEQGVEANMAEPKHFFFNPSDCRWLAGKPAAKLLYSSKGMCACARWRVWSCAVKVYRWLIRWSCDSSITAVTFFTAPPPHRMFPLYALSPVLSPLSTAYVQHHVCLVRYDVVVRKLVCSALHLLLPQRHDIRQRAIKKLNFNKIIAFIFFII